MTKPLLQNHLWSQQFPGHHPQFGESRRTGKLFLCVALIESFLLIVSILFLVLLSVLRLTDWLSWDYEVFHFVANYLWLTTAIFFILTIITHLWSVNAPVREQRLYYKLTNTKRLNCAQRQGLALDLFTVYDQGLWSETLEQFPQAWRVKDQAHRFKLIPLAPQEESIESLQKSWGITSTETAKSTIEQLLKGMHTQSFAKIIKSAPYFVVDTYIKLNFSKEEALEIAYPVLNSVDGYPPQLVWAFDLSRAVNVTRTAFAAQYLTLEEAWEYILRTSRFTFEIFPDRESFYHNLFLGRIFWGHDSKVQETIEMINTFKNCDWPQRSLPWNHRGGQDLPDDIKTGFGITIKSSPSL